MNEGSLQPSIAALNPNHFGCCAKVIWPLRAVFVEYHELLLGGAEGDPTQRQGTRDQGQKNESSAQDREAASSHRKDFRGRNQLPFLLQLPVKSPTIMRQYARHGANWQSIQLDAPPRSRCR